jgi:hypothetical protein
VECCFRILLGARDTGALPHETSLLEDAWVSSKALGVAIETIFCTRGGLLPRVPRWPVVELHDPHHPTVLARPTMDRDADTAVNVSFVPVQVFVITI